jgi:hypothetical protein
MTLAKEEIPVVDLQHLGNEGAAEALRVAFGHYGLVYVKGHDLPDGAVDALYDRFKAFSRFPEAEKRTLGGGDIWYQRGWTPPNTEKAVVGGGQPDFKECYFAAPVPVDPESKIAYPQVYADNVWPASKDGFDADAFAVEFNDIDLCLRLAAAGHGAVWTPDALLSHRESASRGRPGPGGGRHGDQRARFLTRWGDFAVNDPFFHPAFSLASESPRLA